LSYRRYLLPVYAVATLFPRLLDIPSPFSALQLTELLFPVLLFAYWRPLLRQGHRFPTFSLALAAYLLVNLLAGFFAADAGAVWEAMGRMYLGILPFIVLAYVGRWGSDRLRTWWVRGAVGVAGLAIVAYLAIWMGASDPVRWVGLVADYPYLGEVYRLRGTASTYGMWVMLLLPALVFGFSDWWEGRGSGWKVGILTLALVPTFSKELLLLPIGAILLTGAGSPWRYGVVGVLIVLLYAGTHLVLRPATSVGRADIFVAGEPLAELYGYRVYESVYVPIKRVGWRVGRAHPWLGVGPGRFVDYSTDYTLPDELPRGFGPFDPHSTWTGALAETGWPGLLSLSGLVIVLWRRRHAADREVAVLLLLFLLTTGFKDVMNFRGVWLGVGWYLSGGSVGERVSLRGE
jgi:O-antigen ligase